MRAFGPLGGFFHHFEQQQLGDGGRSLVSDAVDEVDVLGITHGLHVVLERLTKLGEVGQGLVVLGFVIHRETLR